MERKENTYLCHAVPVLIQGNVLRGRKGGSLVEPNCYQELVNRQGQRRVPNYLARYDCISNKAMLHGISGSADADATTKLCTACLCA